VNILGKSSVFHIGCSRTCLSPLSGFDYSLDVPIHSLFFLAEWDLKKKINLTVLETIYAGFLKWRCQRRN